MSAAVAAKPSSLSQQLSARRSPEAKQQAQRLWWTGALTSLWAPLTITALAMVPYLFVVELSPASATWAFPVMQGFGLLMVAIFALLVLLRVVWPAFRTRRAMEQNTDELLAEVATALKRDPSLAPEKREKLVAQAAALDARRLASDVPGMIAEGKSLAELAQKTLPGSFRKSPTVDLVVGLVKALLVALLIRAVFIEPYRIPSGSMIPTLQIGDQIFINKLIYGVRLPFMNYVPFVIVRHPERGDVIVFNNPVDTSEDFVKRVAGVPGDSVELRDFVVYVNGVEQKRTLTDPQHAFWDYRLDSGQWLLRHGQLWREDLNGRQHSVIHMPGGGMGGPNEGPYIVPPGHVFVMGDDRDLSSDSRYGLGGPEIKPVFVPYGNIKGKAMIIWLSLSHGGLLSGLTGGAGLQANRFFLPVR